MLAGFLNVQVWPGDGEWWSPTQASASALQQAHRMTTGMHVTLLSPLCWETHSIGAVWEGTHLPVWWQLYCPASRHWEIGGVDNTAWPIRAACRANWKYGLMSHLSYGASTPHNSFCKVGLAFKEKTLRQTWYQMQNRANANVCLIEVMHTLPCWARWQQADLLQLFKHYRILPF